MTTTPSPPRPGYGGTLLLLALVLSKRLRHGLVQLGLGLPSLAGCGC